MCVDWSGCREQDRPLRGRGVIPTDNQCPLAGVAAPSVTQELAVERSPFPAAWVPTRSAWTLHGNVAIFRQSSGALQVLFTQFRSADCIVIAVDTATARWAGRSPRAGSIVAIRAPWDCSQGARMGQNGIESTPEHSTGIYACRPRLLP